MAPPATSQATSQAPSQAPPQATSQAPPPATSQAPPPATSQAPPPATSQAPPHAPPLGPWRDRINNSEIPVIKNKVLSRSGDLVAAAAADAAAGAAVDAAAGAAAGAARVHNQPNNNGGGKKRTKKRAVRRKRSYKKSKKSYKKSKRSYKKSKRGGATDWTKTFTIVKGNSDDPLLEVQLEPNQTGKDLYERVTEWLDQHPDMLTDAEKVGQRKLVTDNNVIVEYAKNLSMFQPRTKLILSIIPEGSDILHGRGPSPEHELENAGA